MTGPPPPHSDDLRDARAADHLNAWLDRTRPAVPGHESRPQLDDPPLAPTVRTAARPAATGLPAATIDSHADHLWEDLMDRHAATAPSPIIGPTSVLTHPIGSRRASLPAAPHGARQRMMGIVATLTLVVLVGLSAFAVYLNAPNEPATPTLLAALGVATPSAATEAADPVPARPDATAIQGNPGIWTLDPVTAYELPVLDRLGPDWNPLDGSHYVWTLDGTAVQAEAHTYVDNLGQRVRTIVAYFPEYGPIDDARAWAQREIGIYQDSLYPRGGEPSETIVSSPLSGCAEIYRTEGLEWITSFRSYATGCFSEDGRTMVFISVSGDILISGGQYQLNPADEIVATILDATSEATPAAIR